MLHLLQPVQQRVPLPQDASVQTHVLPGVPGTHQRQVGPTQHHPVSSVPRGDDAACAWAAHAGHRRECADLPASRDAESLQHPLPAQQREAAGQKVRLFTVSACCKMYWLQGENGRILFPVKVFCRYAKMAPGLRPLPGCRASQPACGESRRSERPERGSDPADGQASMPSLPADIYGAVDGPADGHHHLPHHLQTG